MARDSKRSLRDRLFGRLKKGAVPAAGAAAAAGAAIAAGKAMENEDAPAPSSPEAQVPTSPASSGPTSSAPPGGQGASAGGVRIGGAGGRGAAPRPDAPGYDDGAYPPPPQLIDPPVQDGGGGYVPPSPPPPPRQVDLPTESGVFVPPPVQAIDPPPQVPPPTSVEGVEAVGGFDPPTLGPPQIQPVQDQVTPPQGWVDSDGDGLSDQHEISLGLDPLDADMDDDGLNDNEELVFGTDPRNEDSDGDGYLDGAEVHGAGLSGDDDSITAVGDPTDPLVTPHAGTIIPSQAAGGRTEEAKQEDAARQEAIGAFIDQLTPIEEAIEEGGKLLERGQEIVQDGGGVQAAGPSYPDVGMTPTPAGPIPVPYPNIDVGEEVEAATETVVDPVTESIAEGTEATGEAIAEGTEAVGEMLEDGQEALDEGMSQAEELKDQGEEAVGDFVEDVGDFFNPS